MSIEAKLGHSLDCFHIENMTFPNLATDLMLHLWLPADLPENLKHEDIRKKLLFRDVMHFSLNKDEDEEAAFLILDPNIEEIEDGTELLKQLGGSRYADPIGKVTYCEIEGCATIRIVSRTCQVS